MLIKGIWSFVPETKHIITFFNRLTPIVGPNSTGKTTILENLKLSCSNELPPNAGSGHNFIHDPKVVVETEPNAQIKLQFRTSVGKDVVCIRSFQLTQKALKMEFKAFDIVLQTIIPSNRRGVSKAIWRMLYLCTKMKPIGLCKIHPH